MMSTKNCLLPFPENYMKTEEKNPFKGNAWAETMNSRKIERFTVETWSVYQVLSCRFNTGISWDQCPLNFMSVNYNQLKFQSTFTKKTDILENVCVGGEDSNMNERL